MMYDNKKIFTCRYNKSQNIEKSDDCSTDMHLASKTFVGIL